MRIDRWTQEEGRRGWDEVRVPLTGMEPKQKQYPVVDVTGNSSKARCKEEQYCIGPGMSGP